MSTQENVVPPHIVNEADQLDPASTNEPLAWAQSLQKLFVVPETLRVYDIWPGEEKLLAEGLLEDELLRDEELLELLLDPSGLPKLLDEELLELEDGGTKLLELLLGQLPKLIVRFIWQGVPS